MDNPPVKDVAPSLLSHYELQHEFTKAFQAAMNNPSMEKQATFLLLLDQLSSKELAFRQALTEIVEREVQKILRGATVQTTGSGATGFGPHGCDLDLVIGLNGYNNCQPTGRYRNVTPADMDSPEMKREVAKIQADSRRGGMSLEEANKYSVDALIVAIYQHLAKAGKTEVDGYFRITLQPSKPHLNKRKSILELVIEGGGAPGASIDVDMSIQRQALFNTSRYQTVSCIDKIGFDSRLRKLSYVVRRFMDANGFTKQRKGLSHLAQRCLLLHYLSVEVQVMPDFKSFRKYLDDEGEISPVQKYEFPEVDDRVQPWSDQESSGRSSKGTSQWQEEAVRKYLDDRPAKSEPLLPLLRDFLLWLSRTDFEQIVISLETGEVIQRRDFRQSCRFSKDFQITPVCIQNIDGKDNNISHHCTSAVLKRIQVACRTAAAFLQQWSEAERNPTLYRQMQQRFEEYLLLAMISEDFQEKWQEWECVKKRGGGGPRYGHGSRGLERQLDNLRLR